jgi:hypothetical protein
MRLSEPPVYGSNHTLAYTLDTVPPSFRDEQAISRTDLTLQSFRCPESIRRRIPYSLVEGRTLSTFHHLFASDSRVCSASDTGLDVVKDGIAQVRLEETDLLPAS